MVTAGARDLAQAALARQRVSFHVVMGKVLACPDNPLGQKKAPKATVLRFDLQALLRAKSDPAVLMLSPDFEGVLFLALPLAG